MIVLYDPTDMDKRRRFGRRQRAALWLLADGRCQRCGETLGPGWHADHVKPWSRGGPTSLGNGAALCAKCNIDKGDRSMGPHERWQRRMRDDFYAKQPRDYLISATPGAGKTRGSLQLAKSLLDEGTVDWIMVVVPTDPLRDQWPETATALGLDLIPAKGPADYDRRDFHGCVMTYAQLAVGVGADLAHRVTEQKRVLAITDEIHHVGANKAWGDGLERALEKADVRLHLTGTPWRQDGQIPFVRYDADGRVAVDFSYEYGEAVADEVCRPIQFQGWDGEGSWRHAGKTMKAKLGAELDEREISALLTALFQPDGEWIPSICQEANTALLSMRQEVANLGGIIFADTQRHAEQYVKILTRITGETPTLVISDMPADAKGKIDEFRNGDQLWLIAVNMVSEGVDIPRLAVGVYASRTSTVLTFRQRVGRLIRRRPAEDVTAKLFIPSVPELLRHASEIEEELRHQLEMDKIREQFESTTDTTEWTGPEPLAAGPAIFDRAIVGGEQVGPAEYQSAKEQCRQHNVPVHHAEAIALILRGTRGVVTPAAQTPPVEKVESKARRRERLKKKVERRTRHLDKRLGRDMGTTNKLLIAAGFPRRDDATNEELEAMLTWLDGHEREALRG